VPGCGLARPANFAMPHGPARHENQPIVPCLDRKPGPRAGVARPIGHGVPSRPGDHRAVPARYPAVPCQARCPSLLGPEYDSVVFSVLARSDPISATELYALLLNYEQRQELAMVITQIRRPTLPAVGAVVDSAAVPVALVALALEPPPGGSQLRHPRSKMTTGQ
jgi:hypothetical protein